jgi:beta-N-acetylhexosaminidase
MVALRGNVPSPALLEDARRGMIGGVLLFPSSPEPSQAGVAAASLQLAAQEGGNPPLLIATDQEGGTVKRFPEGPPAGALSTMSPNQALREGRETASFLSRRSINVDLAPVVDLGLPDSFIEQQGRTIAPHPNRVANVANAFAAGLRQLHVLPVAKHFPGLGMATVNSDEARSVVSGPISSSLVPFRSMIGQGAPAIMVSTAIYTSIDPQHGAAWSPPIIRGLLRRQLGFKGLVFSDDLATAGVNASLDTSAAVVQAARAGVDILMVGDANAFRPAYRAALSAARDGQLSLPNLEQSHQRILQFKQEYGG